MSQTLPLVFSDLDGTFLYTDKSVPQLNLKALDVLAEHGGVFVPCTGRFVRTIPSEILNHPATRFVAHTNGAVICSVVHDPQTGVGRIGETLRVVRLDADRILSVVNALEGRDVLLDIFTDEGVMTSSSDYARLSEFVDDPHVLELVTATRTPVDMPFKEIIQKWRGCIERLTVFWHNPADAEAIRAITQQTSHLSCVSSMSCNFEISDSRATKGAALEWISSLVGVSPEQTVAFGDSANDVPMLLSAGDGVAMANATPEAQAAADHIAASNDECGVAQYLETLFQI